MHRYLTLCLGFLLLAVLAVPFLRAYTRSRELQNLQRFGAAVQANADAFTVDPEDVTITIHGSRPWTSASDFVQPGPGASFLIADVTAANAGTVPIDTDPLGFSLRDAAGREYQTVYAGPDPHMPSREIPQGQHARGWLCFEVHGAGPFLFIYRPSLLSSTEIQTTL